MVTYTCGGPGLTEPAPQGQILLSYWCKWNRVLLNWMEVLGLALGKCEHNLVLGEDCCLVEVSGILTEQITSSCGALTGAL